MSAYSFTIMGNIQSFKQNAVDHAFYLPTS